MILAICRLLLAFLIADVAVDMTGLPIPGPVAGLCLLALWFALRGGVDEATDSLFQRVSPHFALLFLPVASGVVPLLPQLAEDWLFIGVAVSVGTLIALATTGLIAQAFFGARRQNNKKDLSC